MFAFEQGGEILLEMKFVQLLDNWKVQKEEIAIFFCIVQCPLIVSQLKRLTIQRGLKAFFGFTVTSFAFSKFTSKTNYKSVADPIIKAQTDGFA